MNGVYEAIIEKNNGWEERKIEEKLSDIMKNDERQLATSIVTFRKFEKK